MGNGNFISTDIRYRERMNRRRRSTSCSPVPASRGGGGRSRSVGGRSVCAIVEEVGGDDTISGAISGGDVAIPDEVFEDAVETSGGNGAEGGEEVIDIVEVSNVEGGDESTVGNGFSHQPVHSWPVQQFKTESLYLCWT